MFRWAVSYELLPGGVYEALRTVEALRAGRTSAAESVPVPPVDTVHVKVIQNFVSRQVWAMVRLQLYTGMRPGEVCQLRPCDLDTSNEKVWVWRPRHHKTAHHSKRRVIRVNAIVS